MAIAEQFEMLVKLSARLVEQGLTTGHQLVIERQGLDYPFLIETRVRPEQASFHEDTIARTVALPPVCLPSPGSY